MVYAHTPPPGSDKWHELDKHLIAVAEMAKQFAEPFGAGELAYWLGLWHDVGKCNPKFQEYLQLCYADPHTKRRGPDHKAAGTIHALAHAQLQMLGLLIQGHHGGLRAPTEFKTWLRDKGSDGGVNVALAQARGLVDPLDPPASLDFPSHVINDRSAAELFLRMLFSALVDADFLDTEQHFAPEQTTQRGTTATLADLWQRFERDQQQVSGQHQDVVSQARHAVYQSCVAAAASSPGLFRLAVPTGGGKTRSAMAFALQHALAHGHQRIIVAVPFISITEQTADVYRALFGAENDEQPVVLEHHSAARGTYGESDDFDPAAVWRRLSAENWDAPIVVTTTVQLFHSLFSNGTSPCRKLHRLARSIIILDEAQALPPHLLQPILDVLQQLCTRYGTTVVISTATQPTFEAIPIFAAAQATDIVHDAARWFDVLRRVRYEWDTHQAKSWEEIAVLLQTEAQALAVVNTKKDSLALLDVLDNPNVLHLSTLLCGAHRRAVIDQVKQRLQRGEPCRLVSTQVIEAGVDLDFPFVLRALGPLDSIIQAAGRCNREGRLQYGRMVVVRPQHGGMPPGAYRTATGITEAVLGGGTIDPADPAVAKRYFAQLFQTVETDRDGIQALRASFNYPDVAQRFRMINDDTEDVVVLYGLPQKQAQIQRIIDQLQHDQINARYALRRLQPYMVSLRTREAARYRQQGLIQEVIPGVGMWLGQYDAVRGLSGTDLDLEQLVV